MSEEQISLFSAAQLQPVNPFKKSHPAPSVIKQQLDWPADIVLKHPAGLTHENGNIVYWTGRGRPPRWALEWAINQGIECDRESVREALAAANGIDWRAQL